MIHPSIPRLNWAVASSPNQFERVCLKDDKYRLLFCMTGALLRPKSNMTNHVMTMASLTIRHQHIAENLFLYKRPITDARKYITRIMPSLRQILYYLFIYFEEKKTIYIYTSSILMIFSRRSCHSLHTFIRPSGMMVDSRTGTNPTAPTVLSLFKI